MKQTSLCLPHCNDKQVAHNQFSAFFPETFWFIKEEKNQLFYKKENGIRTNIAIFMFTFIAFNFFTNA